MRRVPSNFSANNTEAVARCDICRQMHTIAFELVSAKTSAIGPGLPLHLKTPGSWITIQRTFDQLRISPTEAGKIYLCQPDAMGPRRSRPQNKRVAMRSFYTVTAVLFFLTTVAAETQVKRSVYGSLGIGSSLVHELVQAWSMKEH